jgi:hypothetical protein
MHVIINPQSLIVLLCISILAIISLTYVASSETPKYDDWRRTFLLILGVIVTIYSSYSVSIKLYILSRKNAKITDVIIPLTFNVVSLTLGSIIINYASTDKEDWNISQQNGSWQKDTINTLSIVILILIFLIILMYLVASSRGNNMLKLSIKGLIPAQKDAIVL